MENNSTTATTPTIVTTPDVTQDQLLSFKPFKTWWDTTLHSLSQQQNPDHPFSNSPYVLQKVEIQAVDFFGGERIGFVKFKATVSNEAGEKLPGAVFLRGGSVAMLLILQPEDAPSDSDVDKHVIMTVQPRIPAGSLGFLEIPAGMLDDSGTFSGAAAKEIKEETGLKVPRNQLVDLTKLALDEITESGSEALQAATYPSPGGSDEHVAIFLHERRVPRKELASLQRKLTGLRKDKEKISLRLLPLKDLWKLGARDGKTLSALALYEGLKRTGKV